jgi:hypothetical protein
MFVAGASQTLNQPLVSPRNTIGKPDASNVSKSAVVLV